MQITITGRDLALTLGAGLIGLLAARSVTPAQAQETPPPAATTEAATTEAAAPTARPTCTETEISVWVPVNSGACVYPNRFPYVHEYNWCPVPEGAKVIGSVILPDNVAAGVLLQRCKQ
ncbi:MAG: hypothetical protein H6741_01300 [Alphaproteobacteria bacterium]|nr:hypothetical protein [Alphaproteobacteria bacterium]